MNSIKVLKIVPFFCILFGLYVNRSQNLWPYGTKLAITLSLLAISMFTLIVILRRSKSGREKNRQILLFCIAMIVCFLFTIYSIFYKK